MICVSWVFVLPSGTKAFLLLGTSGFSAILFCLGCCEICKLKEEAAC